MITQPEWGTRNVTKLFYEEEKKKIEEINEVIGEIKLTKTEEKVLIWLAGWDEYVVRNVLSVMKKLQEK